MSLENLRKIAQTELDITIIILNLVRKLDSEQTDRHTKNLKLFGASVQTFWDCLQKISERYLIQN